MPRRGNQKADSVELVTGNIYHVYNRIIGGMPVFQEANYAGHFVNLFDHCKSLRGPYSIYSRPKPGGVTKMDGDLFRLVEPIANPGGLQLPLDNYVPVRVHAFVVMPNHFHLILEQLVDGGVTRYVGRVLNSLTKGYNKVQQRIGPLWQSRFKAKWIGDDESYLQVMRYVHLNPVRSSMLSVDDPASYRYSSYCAAVGLGRESNICDHTFLHKITNGPSKYRHYVNSQVEKGEHELAASIAIEEYFYE